MPLAVTRAERVYGKLKICGCNKVNDEYEASIKWALSGREFFIPKPLIGGGYTQDQLDEIEQCLVFLGIDLFPLDDHAV